VPVFIAFAVKVILARELGMLNVFNAARLLYCMPISQWQLTSAR